MKKQGLKLLKENMTTQSTETRFKPILIPTLLLYLQKYGFPLTASKQKYIQSRKEDTMYGTFDLVHFQMFKDHLQKNQAFLITLL